jgi:hypothetical protein
MVEAGKTITMIALRLKTNSHRCSRSIGDSQGLTKQGWAAPKGKPTEPDLAALIAIVLRRIVLRRPY